MPPLVRKLSITASSDALILQPLHPRASPVRITYAPSHTVGPLLSTPPPPNTTASDPCLESHGVLGLLNLGHQSFLVAVTGREQVAQIRSKAVYVVTDVSFVPLSGRVEAGKALVAGAGRGGGKKNREQGVETDTETESEIDDEQGDGGSTVGTDDGLGKGVEGGEGGKEGTRVAQEVIKDKGRYGRFAERWFGRVGWRAGGAGGAQGPVAAEGQKKDDDLSREQRRQGLKDVPESDGQGRERPEGKAAEADTVDADKRAGEVIAEEVKATAAEGIVATLTPRILRTMKVWLSSRSFYFSYDWDLSRRWAVQDQNGSSSVPLFKRFDPQYFWNQHLLKSFIETGQYAFALPVIQGFVGQRAFTVGKTPKGEDDKILDSVEDAGEVIELWERAIPRPDVSGQPTGPSNSEDDEPKDFLLTLISRRSVNRAGLRYLRRGVDDAGNVANNIESEQLLSDPLWNEDSKVFSLVQVRGSIPLFFSQSPYSFKPIPITYGSEETNHHAFNKHFSCLKSIYGKVQIASLVDKHGTEKSIGELYQHHVELTNEGQLPSHGFPGPSPVNNKPSSLPAEKSLSFTWFDFHHECRAFNFQNVSYLLDVLAPSLTSHTWTESVASRITQTQSGVVRTNCMDCLDRTNVVQSAIAGQVLTTQLSKVFGLSIDLTSDPRTQWFNTLWADNGDAISKQYSGTAALKGDFTRTRKRTWQGAINDFSHTLGRYYNNIFGDYFLQTTIDFVLGNGGDELWEEFESEMATGDYALDVARVRQGAVELCVRVVLGHGTGVSEDETAEKTDLAPSDDRGDEDLISGYTLQTPAQPNTLKSQPFEECVLLLTNKALYAVRFDWNTEKVGSYERVELKDISGIRKGAYVTSTLGNRNLDEEKNRGFVLRYRDTGRGGITRVNTRSLSTEVSNDRERDVDGERGQAAKDEGAQQQDMQTVDGKVVGKDFADEAPKKEKEVQGDLKGDGGPPDIGETRILAFKALAPRHTATTSSSDVSSSRSGKGKRGSAGVGVQDMSEREVVDLITEEVHRLVTKALPGKKKKQVGASQLSGLVRGVVAAPEADGEVDSSVQSTWMVQEGGGVDATTTSQVASSSTTGEEDMWQIQDEAIISVEEARRSAGYLETIGYSLRKLVWS